jgi:hypothetical protein
MVTYGATGNKTATLVTTFQMQHTLHNTLSTVGTTANHKNNFPGHGRPHPLPSKSKPTRHSHRFPATGDLLYTLYPLGIPPTWHPKTQHLSNVQPHPILSQRLDQMIFAFNQPRNLRDLLMPTTMKEPPDRPVSSLFPPTN